MRAYASLCMPMRAYASLREPSRAFASPGAQDLLNIARTTLSSKLLRHEKNHFAELAVNAVLRLKGKQNMDYIQAREERDDLKWWSMVRDP